METVLKAVAETTSPILRPLLDAVRTDPPNACTVLLMHLSSPALQPMPQVVADTAGDVAAISMAQVAQLPGICESELALLVEYGVLKPVETGGNPRTFNLDCVILLQRADQLRHDLALDSHAFALAVMLLDQITYLESRLVDARLRFQAGHVDGAA